MTPREAPNTTASTNFSTQGPIPRVGDNLPFVIDDRGKDAHEWSGRRLTVYEVVRAHGLLPATADFLAKMHMPSAVRILHHTLPAHVLLRLLESIRPVCKADSKVGGAQGSGARAQFSDCASTIIHRPIETGAEDSAFATLDVILAPMRKKERGDDLLLAMNPHHSLQLPDPDHLPVQTRPKKKLKVSFADPLMTAAEAQHQHGQQGAPSDESSTALTNYWGTDLEIRLTAILVENQ